MGMEIQSKEFTDAETLAKTFMELPTWPLPLEIWEVKLTHDNPEQNHYLYLFNLGNHAMWVFDAATDYSGTGGRYKQHMDIFLNWVTTILGPSLEGHFSYNELEIPYEFYSTLKNALWKIYSPVESYE